MHLAAIRAFVEVARHGSFSSAAQQLGLSRSSASRLVQDLEADLGVTLLLRTTRRVALSEAGKRYYARCRDLLNAADALRQDAHGEQDRPRGPLHVDCTRQLARKLIVPLLPGFLSQYPEVSVHLRLDAAPEDRLADTVDVAIRMGDLPDAHFSPRRLGSGAVWLLASPDFVARRGAPRRPEEVSRYPCIVDTTPGFKAYWPLGQPVPVEGPIVVNDADVATEMALAGLGLALLPEFFVAEEVAAGRLLRILHDEPSFKLEVSALFPHRSGVSTAALAFVDRLAHAFSG